MSLEEKLILLKEKLDKVVSDRTEIIQAIRAKGVSIPADTLLEDIPAYIMIISGGGGDTSYVLDTILYLVDKDVSYAEENLTFNEGANYSNGTLIL